MDLHIVSVPAEIDDLKILVLGDLHIGHRCFDEKLLDKYLSQVDDATRILLLGDLFEAGTRRSPGRLDDRVMGVTDQRVFLEAKLDRYRTQIDAAVTGNHEERIPSEGGDDPMDVLCRLLDTQEHQIRYFQYAGIVAYVTEKSNACGYTIALRHGASNAMLPGGAVNAAQRYLWNAYADVYVSGHVHKPSWTTNIVEVPDLSNRVMLQREQHIITNGALLSPRRSYAEMKGYPIAKPCQAMITLHMVKKGRQITVDFD